MRKPLKNSLLSFEETHPLAVNRYEELYNLMQEYASEDVIFKIKSDFIPLSDVYALQSSDFIPY